MPQGRKTTKPRMPEGRKTKRQNVMKGGKQQKAECIERELKYDNKGVEKSVY